jgi:hypothetical protein
LANNVISLLDYEKLPAEVKMKANELLRELKDELRDARFSLKFLGFDAIRWVDLTAPKFLALGEEHYLRLVKGSKWLRSLRREDLCDRISELFKLVDRTPKQKQTGLDQWASQSATYPRREER